MKTAKGSTRICGFDKDNVLIRGKNLTGELIGQYSFAQLFYLQSLGREPTPAQSKIVDTVMVTIMEHGLVPSAVVTRMTHYGAPESFQGAVVAGLLGVGDRYAGTAGECGALLERLVGAPAEEREQTTIDVIREYRAIKRPIPGFGHPIHSEHDARVDKLIGVVEQLDIEGHFIGALRTLEDTLESELNKGLVTNISAAIGAVLGEAGIPAHMMRGVVLTARCAGLVGHLNEEMQNPASPAMWAGAQDAVDYVP